MFDSVAALKKETITADNVGNQKRTYTSRTVFCQKKSVSMREHYAAALADISPEITIVLPDVTEYDGEKIVELPDVLGEDGEPVIFSVERTYIRGHRVELTLKRRIGNG